MIPFIDYLIRMGSALLLGTAIGVERQYRRCNAGLRTNILVSVGSAAFTILSFAMSAENGDPSRIAAQIVSGIGFLGGGLILKDGISVRGLNTAATIWCSAACGTLSGTGLYAEAAVLVICVISTHCIFRPLCSLIERNTVSTHFYSVQAECPLELSEKARQTITNTLAFNADIKMTSLFYKESTEGTVIIFCDLETRGEQKTLLDLLATRLRSLYGVSHIGWKERNYPQEDF